MTDQALEGTPTAVRSSSEGKRGHALAALAFLSPYLLLFFLFMLLPTAAAVAISFMRWDILGTPEWNGLDNYRQIFADPLFLTAIKNTFYFVFLTAIPMVVLGLALAMLLDQRLKGTAFVRTVVFLPYVVMVSTVGILWGWLFDKGTGLVNHYLTIIGVEPIAWLKDPDWSMPALAITTIWWTVNTNMIIFLAALQDIPEELHDAATVDGAGSWQRFVHITLPLLQPAAALVTALTIINGWRVFGQAYVMTQGGPEASTFVIVQYIYLTAFQNFEMGPAAAAGVVLLLVTLLFSLVQLKMMKAI
ncbi:carbohydrate ABC transporter permease [Mesorhizobium muleiense]|uniref:carbohydrate ABC transporter permease n=1 Tax=Mesorhizobium muleiense TaxID=1004279 RepID=UPI001F34F4EE|nr:sugar ABC transporter permease [Mesorhizobium muleiense]MCF6112150.1 sugar ABC transporter permease [Mesorhizobium muleiense]